MNCVLVAAGDGKHLRCETCQATVPAAGIKLEPGLCPIDTGIEATLDGDA